MGRPVKERQRAKKPKVKTGCITCKHRRIKCGEEKPHCSRCTSTGRKCDGYEPVPQPRSFPSSFDHSAMISLPVNIGGDVEERRSFQFFYEKTMPEISGYIPSDFWSKLVLPATQADPTVLHAVIALSAIHEISTTIQKDDVWLARQNFAIQQSAKAVRYCCSLPPAASRSVEVALTSSILFFFVESFQKNHRAALFHLDWGMRILRDSLSDDPEPETKSPPENLIFDKALVKKILVPIFARLDISANNYMEDRRIKYDQLFDHAESAFDAVSIPVAFSSLKEADESLVMLLYWMLNFYQTTRCTYWTFNLHQTAQSQEPLNVPGPDTLRGQCSRVHNELEVLLRDWLEALNGFVKQRGTNMETRQLRAVVMLKARHLIASISNQAKRTPDDMGFDNYSPEFERIISLSSSLLLHPSYSVDLNLAYPLYATACMCRDPIIRRRALALLKKCPQIEGVWNSDVFIAIAEWVLQKEEGGLGEVLTAKDIPPSARISVLYKRFLFGERKCLIKYYQKATCADGPNKFLRKEVIEW
ncbi:hypothetical protein B0O99DRAFT_744188 [Bisporella sp. PMI_857]|nr:hypothetical protein B0O99DRAFT_744188 [Bisporella sp. PMI_857]